MLDETGLELTESVPVVCKTRDLRSMLGKKYRIPRARLALYLMREVEDVYGKTFVRLRSLDQDGAMLDSYSHPKFVDGDLLCVCEEERDVSRAEEDLERVTEHLHSLQAELFERTQELAYLEGHHEEIRKQHDGHRARLLEQEGKHEYVRPPTQTQSKPVHPRATKEALRKYLRAADRSQNDPFCDSVNIQGKAQSGTVRVVNGKFQWMYRVGSCTGTTWSDLRAEILSNLGIPPSGSGRLGFTLRSKSGGLFPSSSIVFEELKKNRNEITVFLVYEEPIMYVDVLHNTEKHVARTIKSNYKRSKSSNAKLTGSINVTRSVEATRNAEILLSDLPRFLVFFFIFAAVTVNRFRIQQSYYYSSAAKRALTASLVRPPAGIVGRTYDFYGVNTLDEIWGYLEGPFAEAVSQPWAHNNQTIHQIGYVNGESKVVGGFLIRQLRVTGGLNTTNACPISRGEGVRNMIDGCYPAYNGLDFQLESDEGAKGTATFGAFPSCRNTSAFNFKKDGDALVKEWFYSSHGIYDPSGYFEEIDIGNGTEHVRSQLRALKNCRWLDKQTRAVFVQMNLFNPNYNKWLTVTLEFEHAPSGLVYPWARFQAIDLDGYYHPSNLVYAVLDILLLVLALTTLHGWWQQARCVPTDSVMLL